VKTDDRGGDSMRVEKRSPNGIRTRISALRGLRPKPLDDRARELPKRRRRAHERRMLPR
jgi:hypothetical protein